VKVVALYHKTKAELVDEMIEMEKTIRMLERKLQSYQKRLAHCMHQYKELNRG
jgi:predicted RNase H-like nuclease (RuvC/YqgF family)